MDDAEPHRRGRPPPNSHPHRDLALEVEAPAEAFGETPSSGGSVYFASRRRCSSLRISAAALRSSAKLRSIASRSAGGSSAISSRSKRGRSGRWLSLLKSFFF